MFRSTGSYEPDRNTKMQHERWQSFDPQALTSLTLMVEPSFFTKSFRSTGSYEPDLFVLLLSYYMEGFRSTGSYEPDHPITNFNKRKAPGFDPQALTSLTSLRDNSWEGKESFDPQALTSLTSKNSWF